MAYRGAQRTMTNTSKTTNFVLYLHKISNFESSVLVQKDVRCWVSGAIELFKYTEMSCGTSDFFSMFAN